jgi:hypothetical protein
LQRPLECNPAILAGALPYLNDKPWALIPESIVAAQPSTRCVRAAESRSLPPDLDRSTLAGISEETEGERAVERDIRAVTDKRRLFAPRWRHDSYIHHGSTRLPELDAHIGSIDCGGRKPQRITRLDYHMVCGDGEIDAGERLGRPRKRVAKERRPDNVSAREHH